MKYILSIALRNLKRHKLRTVISILAIVIAIIIGIFYRSILLGYSETTIENFIQLESGHARIVNKEYARRERVLPLMYPVDGFQGEGIEQMRSQLVKNTQIVGTLPRIKFGASYVKEDEIIRMMGWGVDVKDEIKFTDFDKHLISGHLPSTDKREITVGSSLLEKLDKKVGEKVTLIYNTSFSSIQGSTFNIIGSIQTGLSYFDANIFLTSLDQAQEILYMPNQSTELLLFTQNKDNINVVIDDVDNMMSAKNGNRDYQISSWLEAGGIIRWLMAYQNVIYIVIAFIVFLASIIIINTLLMVIKERTREIGTLGALGMTKREIILLFTTEGAIMGTIGSFIGVVIGGTLTYITSQVGIDFGEVMDAMGDTLISPVVYPVFSFENLLVAFIIGSVVSTLSCIIPARKAAEIEPSEAMKDI